VKVVKNRGQLEKRTRQPGHNVRNVKSQKKNTGFLTATEKLLSMRLGGGSKSSSEVGGKACLGGQFLGWEKRTKNSK